METETDKPIKPRRGRKPPKMIPFAIRLTPQTWERLGFLATEHGCDRAEITRRILVDGTKNARPPEDAQFCGIHGIPSEIRAWRDLADRHGESVESLARHVLNSLATQAFGEK